MIAPRVQKPICSGLALLALLLVPGAGRSADTGPFPAAPPRDLVAVTGPLSVKVGDAVSWHFQVKPQWPRWMVVDAWADRQPFGVLRDFDAKTAPGFVGSVLGSQFRYGTLTVRVRDVARCEIQSKSATSLAMKNMSQTTQASATVSLVSCSDLKQAMPEFETQQLFSWQLVGTPDAGLSAGVIGILTKRMLCLSQGTCGGHFITPQTGPAQGQGWVSSAVTDGALAPLMAGTCGTAVNLVACRREAPACVWSGATCGERRFYP